MNIVSVIWQDFKAKAHWNYEEIDFCSTLRAMLSDGSLAMLMYRVVSWLNKNKISKPIALIIYKLNSIINGCVIGANANFGRNFIILHSFGVVINSKVRGGNNIIIESGVVIGEEKKGCPVLGNDIFIGSGAKIFGKLSIGNNVTIGANAVVNTDFPDNVVIGGVPAKILRGKEEWEKKPLIPQSGGN